MLCQKSRFEVIILKLNKINVLGNCAWDVELVESTIFCTYIDSIFELMWKLSMKSTG